MNKRGFFFVLISFLILVYLTTYITIWSKTIKISERTMSDEIKFSSLEKITPLLSKKYFQDFFEIAGYYALYRMDEHSIKFPLKYNKNNELYYFNKSFFSLVYGGESDYFTTPLKYYGNDYSFLDYKNRLNKLFEPYGFKISDIQLYDSNISYIDPVTFNASTKLRVVIEGKNVFYKKEYSLSKIFNVSGFIDPMIAREAFNIGLTKRVEKQIFYKEVKNFSPNLIYFGNESDGYQGRGFFYGELVSPSKASSINDEEKKYYILYGSFDDIIDTPNYDYFGAYIITSKVNHTDACGSEEGTFNELHYDNGCHLSYINYKTNKSFVVIPDFDIDKIRNNRVLFITKNSLSFSNESKFGNIKVFDIESIRDYIICSYYIPSTRGPSFVQRMSENALYLHSPYGIESTVLGRWAGGEYTPDYDPYSRVGFLFFRKETGDKIRGLPGCKFFWMCNTPSSEENPLGRFVLDSDSIRMFGLENITCNDGYAECEE